MKHHGARIVFGEEQKKELRKPFGRCGSINQIKRTKRKIIAVGDETTLTLISAGILPHMAVCDFKIKRAGIKAGERKRITDAFGKARRSYKNPKGTLSWNLLANAKDDMKKGGLIRIIGEEDITALAFMLNADEKYLVLYGQPDKGMVIVKPENKRLKMKIKKLLSVS